MQLPDWTKPGLWGAVCGAIAMSIVGFSYLGWKTASSADQLASDRADTAVVTAMVPFCVIKAKAGDPAEMTKFNAEQSSYSRNDIVMKAGWATLNDAKFGDNALARACSEKLHAPKAG